jgi:acyl-CoA reductase-like NAD-dependent aldehyde dehydrogenase
MSGGTIVEPERYVAPTVVRVENRRSPLLAGEIFGPILPVISYKRLSAALASIREAPDPLVVYLFSGDSTVQDTVRQQTVSGNYAINAGLEIVATTTLPFGGVGASGMGRYHGRFGFEAFSYRRAELRKGLHPELKLRYPPYRAPFGLMKRILRSAT